jgi:transcription elongation factor Elf1
LIDSAGVQKKLNQVSCPVCGNAQFQVAPERPVEGSLDEAYFSAICRRCDLKIKVVAIPPAVIEQLESMEPHEKRPVTEGRCPFCNKVGAAFDFRCHLKPDVGFDIVTCRHCSQPYKEPISAGL